METRKLSIRVAQPNKQKKRKGKKEKKNKEESCPKWEEKKSEQNTSPEIARKRPLGIRRGQVGRKKKTAAKPWFKVAGGTSYLYGNRRNVPLGGHKLS